MLRRICFFYILIVCIPSFGAKGLTPAKILQKMQESYAEVKDYQTHVLVRRYEEGGSASVWRFKYTFKKPRMIRIDFQSPHKGMVIVYSEQEGEAVVQPFLWMPFIKFHLSLSSNLITDPSGQRIDQTDMGQLIENIGKSLTTERKDDPMIDDSGTVIEVRVLAEDHFHRDQTTYYRFLIDKTLWLPVGVDEQTPDGVLKREMRFHDFRTNLGITGSFFKL